MFSPVRKKDSQLSSQLYNYSNDNHSYSPKSSIANLRNYGGIVIMPGIRKPLISVRQKDNELI